MFTIVYHEKVREDFDRIGKNAALMISKTITKKLTVNPEQYGEKLAGDLKGLWKLKVSKYRVVYLIQNDIVKVFIIAIDHRRAEKAYQLAVKRTRYWR